MENGKCYFSKSVWYFYNVIKRINVLGKNIFFFEVESLGN